VGRESDFSRAIAVLAGDVRAFSNYELENPHQTLDEYYGGHGRFASFPESRQDEAENILEREKDRRAPPERPHGRAFDNFYGYDREDD